MESTFQPPPSARKLAQAFGLGEAQETILSLLMKTSGYELDEEFCRSKLKSIKPNFVSNFQQQLKMMEQKGTVLVGYKPDGIKFIKMTPPEKMIKMIEESSSSPASKFKPRSPRLTQQEIDTIKEDTLFFIKETPGITKEALFDKISKKYTYISLVQFQNIFRIISSSRLVKISRIKKGKFQYTINDTQKDASGKVQPITFDRGRLTIILESKDIDGLRLALRKFFITDDPAPWIKEKAEEIIIKLLSQQMPIDDITLNADYWHKLSWLKDDFQEKEKTDVIKTLSSLITNFIDREYEKRFIRNQVASIISSTKSADVLRNLKETLEKQLQSVENVQK